MYNKERYTLLSTLRNFDNNPLDFIYPSITKTLLFDSNYFNMKIITNILNANIEYVFSTKRFGSPHSQ